MLKTLRERMKRSRSKGHALYQAVVHASTPSKSQSAVATVTASKSSEVQTPKQRDTVSATLITDDELSSASKAKAVTGQKPATDESVTFTSIVEDTYAMEQKLATQVLCVSVCCKQALAPSECAPK